MVAAIAVDVVLTAAALSAMGQVPVGDFHQHRTDLRHGRHETEALRIVEQPPVAILDRERFTQPHPEVSDVGRSPPVRYEHTRRRPSHSNHYAAVEGTDLVKHLVARECQDITPGPDKVLVVGA
jgi:hypothetical protein